MRLRKGSPSLAGESRMSTGTENRRQPIKDQEKAAILEFLKSEAR